MMLEFWQHKKSGEVYAVGMDLEGDLCRSKGPLTQREIYDIYMAGTFEDDPDLTESFLQEMDLDVSLYGVEDSFVLAEQALQLAIYECEGV